MGAKRKFFVFLIVCLVIWRFFGGGVPQRGIGAIGGVVEGKCENYTILLTNLQYHTDKSTVMDMFENYYDNFLCWAENIENIDNTSFWILMDNLAHHNEILENFRTSIEGGKSKVFVKSPTAYRKPPPPNWDNADNGYVLFYDDNIYGYAKSGQKDLWGGYDFIISPYTITIDGIEVVLKDTYRTVGGGNKEWVVRLSWDNGNTWTSSKSTGNITEKTNPGGTYVIGGPTDNWGRGWTDNEINKDNFWTEIKSTGNTIYLDYVYVEVYVTENWNDIILLTDNTIAHKSQVETILRERFPQYLPCEWRTIEKWEGSVESPIPAPISKEEVKTVREKYVILDWEPVAEAEYYEVQYSTSPEFHTYTVTTTETSTTLTGLPTGTYYWRVRAFIGEAVSPWSETYIIQLIVPKELPLKYEVPTTILIAFPVFIIFLLGLIFFLIRNR